MTAAIAVSVSVAQARQSNVNPPRVDPYKGYRIELQWAGGPAAGFSTEGATLLGVGGLPTLGGPSSSGKYYTLVLNAGVTWNAAFAQWAAQSVKQPAMAGLQNLTVLLRKTPRAVPVRYAVTGCWVSEYRTMPAPAGSPESISQMTLRCSPPLRPPPIAPWHGG